MLGLLPTPTLAQIFFNTGEASYLSPNNPTPLNTTSNTIETPKGLFSGIRVETVGAIEWDGNGFYQAGDYVSFTFRVTNLSTSPNPIRIPQQVRTLNLGAPDISTLTAVDGGNEVVILYDLNQNEVIEYTDVNGNGRWDPFGNGPTAVPGSPETGAEVWIYRAANDDYVNANGTLWSSATVFVPPGDDFLVYTTEQVPTTLGPGDLISVVLGNDGSPVTAIQRQENVPYAVDAPDGIAQDVYTLNRVPGSTTINDPQYLNGPLEAMSSDSAVPLGSPAGVGILAGVRVQTSGAVEWDNDGIYAAGDYISFFFTVTNLSNVSNPIRIPQQVRTLNLGAPNISTLTATNGGNELVILYDINQNGVIEYTDVNGNGRWDPFGNSGFAVPATPETGPEVWTYSVADQDYVNPNAVNPVNRLWSRATVFVPPGDEFLVYATEQAPLDLPTGTPVGAVLGNDGSPDTQIVQQENLPFTQNAPQGLAQDVYTVNRTAFTTTEANSAFLNGQLEASSGDIVTGIIQLGLVTVDVDLGITLTQVSEDLVPGNSGVFDLAVTNNGPGTIDRFMIANDFAVILDNIGLNALSLVDEAGNVIPTPNLQVTIQEDGSFLVTGLDFSSDRTITLRVTGAVKAIASDIDQFSAQVQVKSPLTASGTPYFQDTNPDNDKDQLIDPLGRVVNCDGRAFNNYNGFFVALYEAAGATGSDLGPLLSLASPSQGQEILLAPGVVNVNPTNSNPFDLGRTQNLANDLRGQFNFLFTREQITPGRSYILVIQPPASQSLDQRRIRINILSATDNNFSYLATSLDGLPISLVDSVAVGQEVTVPQGDRNFILLSTPLTPVCQAQALRVQKTADRVTSEPGGFVVYRVTVSNLSTTTINNVVVTDRLPLGFTLLEDSVQAAIGDTPVPIATEVNGRSLTFRFQQGLPGDDPPTSNPLARIVYGVEVTPDALRGDGRNYALVAGDRADNNFYTSDGPAVFEVDVRNGLLTDLGTIVGRVFVDKNFDGEQQYGEPGVPNAVVCMENGNRIVTDKDGLFSVANVLPGWHTGVLDLTSVPGYTYAPNPYVLSSESQVRAVRLEPGGMARMNFAVTPVAADPTEDPSVSPSGGSETTETSTTQEVQP